MPISFLLLQIQHLNIDIRNLKIIEFPAIHLTISVVIKYNRRM